MYFINNSGCNTGSAGSILALYYMSLALVKESIMSSIEVIVESRERLHLFRNCINESIGTRILFSIIDATTAGFTVCGAIWFIDAPYNRIDSSAKLHPTHLHVTLRRTLDSYSQWSRRMRIVPFQPSGGHLHRQRYGRVELCHGFPSDPALNSGLRDLLPQCMP